MRSILLGTKSDNIKISSGDFGIGELSRCIKEQSSGSRGFLSPFEDQGPVWAPEKALNAVWTFPLTFILLCLSLYR